MNKLDMTPVLMRFTLRHGRQILDKECKCGEAYTREVFGVREPIQGASIAGQPN